VQNAVNAVIDGRQGFVIPPPLFLPWHSGGHMDVLFFLQQLLNGLQFGVMLFLMAAGLTLVFGIMDLINLAHGSMFMVGAYLCATVFQKTGSFLLGLAVALPGTALVGIAVEVIALRTLYTRDQIRFLPPSD
jgi:branched-chain amino acid transport system permease protein